ncbi:hypothetical protein [Planctomycetes bacterium Pla163]
MATLVAGPGLAQGVVESAEAAEPLAGPRTATGEEARTEPDDEVRVALRVTNVLGSGRATVDRGAVDGLEVGDVVWLTPREGGRFRADVRSVNERSAVIEMATATFVPVAGTPGEALLPAERFSDQNAEATIGAEGAGSSGSGASGQGAGEGAGDGVNTGAGTDGTAGDTAAGAKATGTGTGTSAPTTPTPTRPGSIWTREDDGFTDDQPLLAGMRAVRPSDRTPFMSGRIYVAADGRITSDAGRSEYFTRVGTDLAYENPFGRGGLFELGVELDRRHFDRPELDDISDTELRFERLSYSLGGTRFGDDRLRFGRFLQGGMAEFGVLDGVEWSRATSENHAFGASVGFMPEPDAEFESGKDFQLAGWWRWVSEATELAAFQVGYQRSFHNGTADRDLVVAKGHFLPRAGWRTVGSMWIDFYSANDDPKGAGPEVTRLYLTTSPYTAGRYGLDLTYSFQRYPYTDRDNVLQAFVEPAVIADERVHRLGADAWAPLSDAVRLVGRAGLWNDSDEDGGDGELGVDVDTAFGTGFGSVTGARSGVRVVAFASSGSFTNVWGARLRLSTGGDRTSYDLFYELANYRQRGFDDDNDDFVQHRVRASATWRPTDLLSINTYLDGTNYNSENGLAAGVFAQWSF